MAFGQLDGGGPPQHLSEINVTPLVDVMLVLLIIFIVTAPLLTHKIKLNLPKAKTEASAVQSPMVVSLTRDIQLYLDGQPITGDELETKLRQSLAEGMQPTVELRADGQLHYEHVVHLMALVQNSGVTKISFITEPGATGGASFPQTEAVQGSR